MRTPADKGGGKGERTQSQCSAPPHAASPRPLVYCSHLFNFVTIITNPSYRAIG